MKADDERKYDLRRGHRREYRRKTCVPNVRVLWFRDDDRKRKIRIGRLRRSLPVLDLRHECRRPLRDWAS